ncbi:MAG: quinolinate synthase NadA [Cyclobacteriaceae bacterium]|nr:quinolinate synthase NadA [Cyclobacteriaceae bacterium]
MNSKTTMNNDLAKEILQLKIEKNAIILAHYYQVPEIQDIADYVGDSLGLSQEAAKTDADVIVFAGVHFMAETAKIINPHKTVLLPDLDAGCSLAESAPTGAFETFIKQHPNHKVITYINCSAEVKALSDITCTSSNAIKVVNAYPKDQPLIFAPDKNLGKYVAQQTGRDLVLWDGACVVHEAFSMEKLISIYKEYPEAEIVAHPESESHILKIAHYIGSTTQMLDYINNSTKSTFIIATEVGILHQIQQDVQDKILIPAPSKEDNTCACSECSYMKMNTLQKLRDCLKFGSPEVDVPEHIRVKAKLPIERMLALSNK